MNTRECPFFSGLCEKSLLPGTIAVGREREMERQRLKRKKWKEGAPCGDLVLCSLRCPPLFAVLGTPI